MRPNTRPEAAQTGLSVPGGGSHDRSDQPAAAAAVSDLGDVRLSPHEVITQDWPPARQHRVPVVVIVQPSPPVSRRHEYSTGTRVTGQPSPPALPVLPVPSLTFALQLSRAGRFGHVPQVGTTAAPATSTTFSKTMLSEHSEGNRRRRGTQPGRSRNLSAPGLVPLSSPYTSAAGATEH